LEEKDEDANKKQQSGQQRWSIRRSLRLFWKNDRIEIDEGKPEPISEELSLERTESKEKDDKRRTKTWKHWAFWQHEDTPQSVKQH
jgi:hypothetical protein